MREEPLVGLLVEVGQVLARVIGVLSQVEVGAIGDPFQLVPPPGEPVLEVGGIGRVVAELVIVVITKTNVLRVDPQILVPAKPLIEPVLEPFGALFWATEELHLHLLELPGPEDELSGCDLVPERLPDLGYAERELQPVGAPDVLVVDEDPLSGLGPKVHHVLRRLDRAYVGPEHQVEVPGLAKGSPVATGGTGIRITELVEAMAAVAVSALNHRICEDLLVTRCPPHLSRLENRRVDADDVGPQLHHRPPPFLLDVAQQLDAERPALLGEVGDGVECQLGHGVPGTVACSACLVNLADYGRVLG